MTSDELRDAITSIEGCGFEGSDYDEYDGNEYDYDEYDDNEYDYGEYDDTEKGQWLKELSFLKTFLVKF